MTRIKALASVAAIAVVAGWTGASMAQSAGNEAAVPRKPVLSGPSATGQRTQDVPSQRAGEKGRMSSDEGHRTRQDASSQNADGQPRPGGQAVSRQDRAVKDPAQQGAGQRSPSTPQQTAMQGGVDVKVSVDTFREKLQPEGQYVEINRLGRAWKPNGVDDTWRPYTNGRWIFNEKVGWYFESSEPWAEITYHYGRWYEDPGQGWVWIADTEWAPAWVEWRHSDKYVGWRPLPPRNAPRVSKTTTTSTTTRHRGGSSVEEEWVFVPTDRITSERISTVVVEEPREVTTIYRETRPVGRVEQRGGITVNFGLDPAVISRDSHVRIESRNLPRADVVPVPQQVQAISTETRAAVSGGAVTTPGATPAQGGEPSGSNPAANAAAPADQTTPGQKPAGDAANSAPADGSTANPATAQGQEKSGTQNKSVQGASPSGTGQDAANQDKAGQAKASQDQAAKAKAVQDDELRKKGVAGKSQASAPASAGKPDATRTEAKPEPGKAAAEGSGSRQARPTDEASQQGPKAKAGTAENGADQRRKPSQGSAATSAAPSAGAASSEESATAGDKGRSASAPGNAEEPRRKGQAAGSNARQDQQPRGAGPESEQTGTTTRRPQSPENGGTAGRPAETGRSGGAVPKKLVPDQSGQGE